MGVYQLLFEHLFVNEIISVASVLNMNKHRDSSNTK